MIDAAELLASLCGQDLLLSVDPTVLDWTDESSPARFIIQSEKQHATLPINNPKEADHLISALPIFLDKSLLIGWDIKSVFSYSLARLVPLRLPKFYDLKLIESYFGIEGEKPTSLKEAKVRLLKVMKPNWAKFEKYYTQIFLPLLSTVLPSIETNKLLDRKTFQTVCSHYEMSTNGRLKTTKSLSRVFLPHSMGLEDRDNLSIPGFDEQFVVLDYKNHEVSVLQWLSKDPNLEKCLQDDVYKGIWRQIVKSEPDEAQREKCKTMFLPVIYGQGAPGLSKSLSIKLETAMKLIDKLREQFSNAFDWVQSQMISQAGYCNDVFGRRRYFEEDKLFKTRNFVIQSPAALICLHKLVRLHEAIKEKARICFSLHDGYGLICQKCDIKQITQISRQILEQEDELFPGLKLKVTCKIGNNLNNLIDME